MKVLDRIKVEMISPNLMIISFSWRRIYHVLDSMPLFRLRQVSSRIFNNVSLMSELSERNFENWFRH